MPAPESWESPGSLERPGLWRTGRQASEQFAGQATDYDRYRPRYPEAVFDFLVSETAAGAGDAVVEIGAGTGIATLPFVARDLDVTAVEPAPELAALAVSKVGDRARVVVDRFEDASLPDRARLLVAFNSWHWVEPGVALDRAWRLLDGGGWLALVWTDVVAWGPPGFDEVLVRVFGAPWPKRLTDVEASLDRVAEDDRFGELRTFHFPFSRTLDAATYVAVCHTYGGQRTDEQYEALRRAIGEELGGSVTKVEDAAVHLCPRR